jgi:hypothetical protein
VPVAKRAVQICRGFTDRQWTELRKRLIRTDGTLADDEDAWRCAVEVFERRIRERFLSCIEALQRADSSLDIAVSERAPADCSTLPKDDGRDVVVPGFAIMALCCLLIETLQSFREGCGSTLTTVVFKKALRPPAFREAFANDKVAESFVKGVRHGILHEAETRGWVIWRDLPTGEIVKPLGAGGPPYVLNRTAFYEALKGEFEDYLRDVRDPQNTDLRKRFTEKMDDIVKRC